MAHDKQAGRRWPAAAWLAAVFLTGSVLGGLGYYRLAPAEQTCGACHAQAPAHAAGTNRVHRGVACQACHGQAAGARHALQQQVRRLLAPSATTRPAGGRLGEDELVAMLPACQRCHAPEFAAWQQSGHGANYAAIFLNEKHNRTEQPADQCLLCHGMFFEGRMAELVTPLDTRGPWRFRNPAMAGRPVMPCLACHQMHAPEPARLPPANPVAGPAAPPPAARRETLAYYVRQEGAHIALDDLSAPTIVDQGRPVEVAADPVRRLCTQCHAPNAYGQAGSSDDRTPTGVHAGLGCADCHAPHSNATRAACAQCHPAASSCGLDVTTMDTTYRARTSAHNIHTVRCLDCHRTGVPQKARPATSGQGAPRVQAP